MINSSFVMFVKLLKILNEIIDPLRIKELGGLSAHVQVAIAKTHLPYDLRWLCVVNCLQVLLHRSIIVPFFVQVISISPQDDVALRSINADLLGQVDRQNIKISLIKNL